MLLNCSTGNARNLHIFFFVPEQAPNGVHQLRWGGRELYMGADKTRTLILLLTIPKFNPFSLHDNSLTCSSRPNNTKEKALARPKAFSFMFPEKRPSTQRPSRTARRGLRLCSPHTTCGRSSDPPAPAGMPRAGAPHPDQSPPPRGCRGW